MRRYQIILMLLIFLTGGPPSWGQQFAPAAPAYSSTPSPTVIVPGAPEYAPSAPVVITPVQPPGPMSYPQPSVLPGAVVTPQPIAAPPIGTAPGGAMVPPVGGVPIPSATFDNPAAPPPLAPNPMAVQNLGPNPITVPVTNEEVAWDQIVDVLSDYFTIAREHRARREGQAWTEGRIETAPLDGATWLEPFRRDSVGSFNRWESTFQTIRRRALVRVIPDAAGYQVEVIVEKELEDLPQPERATAGAAAFRGANTESLPSRRLEDVSRMRSSPHWLLLGRDPLLEQQILAEIQARFGGTVVR